MEIVGSGKDSIPDLDFSGDELRRRYFMRRSIATLHEFNEALRLLNEDNEFKSIKGRFDRRSLANWDRAVKFFKMFDLVLKNVRNDVGGHFGHKAAIFAVENIESDDTGRLQIEEETTGHSRLETVNLPLVSRLVVNSFFRQLPGRTALKRAVYFRRRLDVGYRYALSCVHTLLLYPLADRFE